MLNPQIETFLLKEATERFLRYVKIHTTSDPKTGTHPSSDCQWDLAKLLENELKELGVEDVQLDKFCWTKPLRGKQKSLFLIKIL